MRRWQVLVGVAAIVLGVGNPVAASAGAVAPCSSAPSAAGDWTNTGGSAGGTRYQAHEDVIDVAAAKTLAPVWATKVGDGGPTGAINSTPVVANGCVFVGTSTGDIVALTVSTGKEVWRTHDDVVTAGLGGTIVGSTVVSGGLVHVLINETGDGTTGPYAVALDEHTGRQVWRSAPLETQAGSYTNASPAVIPSFGGAVLFAGWSPAEGDPAGQGGFVLLEPKTGAVVKKTFTIPAADQAVGHAGGGIWAPPVFDAASGLAFVGASNPYSKTLEHERTNALLKIDLRRRGTRHFGEIVGSYKGAPEQYVEELRTLNQTPACEVSDQPGMPYPLDDPVCGQLDLDFGAPANVFRLDGRLVVGALQKAGIYHLVDGATMTNIWRTEVGGPCAACNAAATAVGPDGIGGVSAPGGNAFTLDTRSGAVRWLSPLADGSHYQGVSLANGVFYTEDNAGMLDVLDATTGDVLLKRPMSVDTAQPTAAFSSAGIAIARNTVLVAASSAGTDPSAAAQTGWIIAYRPA
jgi:outer membrane protein assembly factor BamB